jgi:hypothetical protein
LYFYPTASARPHETVIDAARLEVLYADRVFALA